MANEEHLDILREGVDVWNDWRKKRTILPDLSGANLRSMYMSGANLVRANLKGADLIDANLRFADLRRAELMGAMLSGARLDKADLRNAMLRGMLLVGAELRHANLSESDLTMAYLHQADLGKTNLSKATLRYADLSGSRLRQANLHGADLRQANLRGAGLQDADMSEVRLGGTIFFGSRLEGAKGLADVNHYGPSNLDHFTIAQADPALPFSFLRGCGLPDLIINNVEALRGNAIQFYSCFLSHSSTDKDFTRRLYSDLQNEGIRAYYAPEDLKGGEKLHEQLNKAIHLHDKLVLILSEASMDSNWVEHEVRQARQRERKEDRQVLFPITLTSYEELQDWTLFDADEGRNLAREVREYYIPDFSDWKDHDAYQKAFGRLLRDLRAAD